MSFGWDYCLIYTKGSFVCTNPLYIVIDITECYIPTLLIKFLKISVESENSHGELHGFL